LRGRLDEISSSPSFIKRGVNKGDARGILQQFRVSSPHWESSLSIFPLSLRERINARGVLFPLTEGDTGEISLGFQFWVSDAEFSLYW